MNENIDGMDCITIKDMHFQATVGPDRWGKTRPQPITLSVWIYTDLTNPGRTDDVADTVNYGTVYKDLYRTFDGAAFSRLGLHEIALEAASLAAGKAHGANTVRVLARAHNQFLSAECLEADVTRRPGPGPPVSWTTTIRNIRLSTIIGVNPPERLSKQSVIVTVTLRCQSTPENVPIIWGEVYRIVCETIEESSFLTLEAFATRVAEVTCSFDLVDRVTVIAEKPSALVSADASGVQITRSRSFFLPHK